MEPFISWQFQTRHRAVQSQSRRTSSHKRNSQYLVSDTFWFEWPLVLIVDVSCTAVKLPTLLTLSVDTGIGLCMDWASGSRLALGMSDGKIVLCSRTQLHNADSTFTSPGTIVIWDNLNEAIKSNTRLGEHSVTNSCVCHTNSNIVYSSWPSSQPLHSDPHLCRSRHRLVSRSDGRLHRRGKVRSASVFNLQLRLGWRCPSD